MPEGLRRLWLESTEKSKEEPKTNVHDESNNLQTHVEEEIEKEKEVDVVCLAYFLLLFVDHKSYYANRYVRKVLNAPSDQITSGNSPKFAEEAHPEDRQNATGPCPSCHCLVCWFHSEDAVVGLYVRNAQK